MNTELYHFGIKGQKWGIRRFQNEDGSLTQAGKNRYNEDYSEKQRRQDRSMYGKGAEKRINRRMNDGYGIQAARSKEADRINSTRRAARTTGQVGSFVGSIGGLVGGYYATKAVKHVMANSSNTKMRIISEALNDPATNMAISSVVSMGSSAVGSRLGRSGGQSIAMISRGYSPSKYRS